MTSPRVFISYSHDSPQHIAAAIELADRLCREGVDATLDKYQPSPREGWPKWMERQIRQSSFVLVINSQNYKNKFDDDNSNSLGLGVKWESLLAIQRLYSNGTNNSNVIPIIFPPREPSCIIEPLRPYHYFSPFGSLAPLQFDEQEYQSLYRLLTGQPEYAKPPLGLVVPMPSRNTRHAGSPSPEQNHGPSLAEVPPIGEFSRDDQSSDSVSQGGVAVDAGSMEVSIKMKKSWDEYSNEEKAVIRRRFADLLDMDVDKIVIISKNQRGAT